jgi:hypothetical protein
MRDYLGNDVEVGDTVLVALKSGRTATLGRGYVLAHEFKPQYAGGLATNMLLIEWSNIHKYWIPASKMVKLPDYMLPEKRKADLEDTPEGVVPSRL